MVVLEEQQQGKAWSIASMLANMKLVQKPFLCIKYSTSRACRQATCGQSRSLVLDHPPVRPRWRKGSIYSWHIWGENATASLQASVSWRELSDSSLSLHPRFNNCQCLGAVVLELGLIAKVWFLLSVDFFCRAWEWHTLFCRVYA